MSFDEDLFLYLGKLERVKIGEEGKIKLWSINLEAL
jgi:hypothetical protein